MEAAHKWRLRAERYRAFAGVACDSAQQQTRLHRARHFDRIADALEGRAAIPVPQPDRASPLFTPLEALRRAIARLTAVAS